MEWLGLIGAAIVSVVGGITTVLIGRRIDKAHGIPTDLESRLIAEMKEYNTALEQNNKRLEDEAKTRGEMQNACEERLNRAEAREAALLHRMDEAEATIIRLRIRLGENVGL